MSLAGCVKARTCTFALLIALPLSAQEKRTDNRPLAVARERNMYSSARATRTTQTANDKSQAAYLRADDRITDLLNHPTFAGFARLTLPWDDRDYDETMRLRDMGTLLPYHSHVNPDVVVSSLNRMIDDAAARKPVFYDIYTKVQKQAEPARAKTGLFFFRGKKGAPFAVIAAGGGFAYVASVHEGFPYAVEIANRGYNAFVLKYRTGQGGTAATQDLAAAVSYILENAAALGVSRSGYSLWGSSAGARMAAAIGSHGTARFGAPDLPKPSAIVMAYTGHSELGSSDPATFVVVGERDGIAPPSVMERRVALLRQAGTEVEYHKYPGLGHGFGLGIGTSAEGWVGNAVRFWTKQIEREPVSPPAPASDAPRTLAVNNELRTVAPRFVQLTSKAAGPRRRRRLANGHGSRYRWTWDDTESGMLSIHLRGRSKEQQRDAETHVGQERTRCIGARVRLHGHQLRLRTRHQP